MATSPKSRIRVQHHTEHDVGLQSNPADFPIPNLSFVDMSSEGSANTYRPSSLHTPQKTTRNGTGSSGIRTQDPYRQAYQNTGDYPHAYTQGYLGIKTRPLAYRSGYGYTDRTITGHANARQAPVRTTSTPGQSHTQVGSKINAHRWPSSEAVSTNLTERVRNQVEQIVNYGVSVDTSRPMDATFTYNNQKLADRDSVPGAISISDTNGVINDPEDPKPPLYLEHDFSRVYALIDRQRALCTGQSSQLKESIGASGNPNSQARPLADFGAHATHQQQPHDVDLLEGEAYSTNPAEAPRVTYPAASHDALNPSGECNDECSVLSTDISDDGLRVRIAEKTHKGRRTKHKTSRTPTGNTAHQVLDTPCAINPKPDQVTERNVIASEINLQDETEAHDTELANANGDGLALTEQRSGRANVVYEIATADENGGIVDPDRTPIADARRLSTQSWVGSQNTHNKTRARVSRTSVRIEQAPDSQPKEILEPLGAGVETFTSYGDARAEGSAAIISLGRDVLGASQISDVSSLSDSFILSDTGTNLTTASSVSGISEMRPYPPLRLSMPIFVKTRIALEHSQGPLNEVLESSGDRRVSQNMAISPNTVQRIGRDGQPYLSIVTSGDSEKDSTFSGRREAPSVISVLQECVPVTVGRESGSRRNSSHAVRGVEDPVTAQIIAQTPILELSKADSDVTLTGVDLEDLPESPGETSHDSYARLGESAFGTLSTDHTATTNESFSDSSSYDGDVSSAMSHLSVVAESHKGIVNLETHGKQPYTGPISAGVHLKSYTEAVRSLSRDDTHHLSVVAESSQPVVAHVSGDNPQPRPGKRASIYETANRQASNPVPTSSMNVRSGSGNTQGRLDSVVEAVGVVAVTAQGSKDGFTSAERGKSPAEIARHADLTEQTDLSSQDITHSLHSNATSRFDSSGSASDESEGGEYSTGELSIVGESPITTAQTTNRRRLQDYETLAYRIATEHVITHKSKQTAASGSLIVVEGDGVQSARVSGPHSAGESMNLEPSKIVRDGIEKDTPTSPANVVRPPLNESKASGDEARDGEIHQPQQSIETGVESPNINARIEIASPAQTRQQYTSLVESPTLGEGVDVTTKHARLRHQNMAGAADNMAIPRDTSNSTLANNSQAPGPKDVGRNTVNTSESIGNDISGKSMITADSNAVSVRQQEASVSLKDMQMRIDRARKQLSNIAAQLGPRPP